jgi:hypothetical protein
MRRSMTWTGFLAAIFGFAFAVEAFAEDDTREPEVRGASLALIDETDGDGDGIPDAEDNCPEVSNADQADLDGDGPGDVCDNCPEVSNADQVDLDGDGPGDVCDNCLWDVNTAQDDCDDDGCGNLCDCDYDQNGTCGFGDFGMFVLAFGRTDLCRDHTEPVDGRVGFGDFGFFVANFGVAPGPSGTTPGTVACPIWGSVREP